VTTSALTLTVPSLTPSTSVVVIPPMATGQNGVLLGMTLGTSCSDLTVISAAIDSQDQDYRG
jgi:hypothetical protein